MNTLLDTLWYFCYITVELVVLFIVITALVEIILMYIPQEKISKKIEKAGFFGNVIAAGFGALTPFCACSTLPMTVGFLNAGVPFGATMSFLIASPLLNPIIIAMLGALVGIKAMLIYVVIAIALRAGWDTLRPIFSYLIIGVALGAVIYGYMPSDWVLKIAGPDNPFAVPVAAIIGVPLYIRAETAIPIGVALMGKGMSIGAVVSFLTAVISGYIFNLFL